MAQTVYRPATDPVSGRFVRSEPLPARQLEVLRLAADGHTYIEISRLLHIDHTTVKDHVKRLRLRLGARSMVQAVDVAWRRGILEADA